MGVWGYHTLAVKCLEGNRGMAEKIILFRIVVDQENGGFPHASNFITKVVNREPVSEEDVKGIGSKLAYRPVSFKSKEPEYIIEGKDFLGIAKPELLFEGIKGAVCEFCMVVEDGYLQDVLSIQPFILMKLYFREEKVFAVINGESSHYFPMNYFLSDIMQKKGMAGSVYYFQKDKRIYGPLEGKKEGRKITAFYPLQAVDGKMLKFLNCKLEENWMKEARSDKRTIEKFMDTDGAVWEEAPMDFRGLLRSFHDIKFKDSFDEKQAVACIAKASTLSVLIFAFSLRSMKEKKQKVAIHTYQQFESYYQMANDYAAGVMQLIENIVFHAGTHAGVFSMRFHQAKQEKYLQEKFPEALEASCLEVSVVDYCGSNACGNMADNFRENIGQEEKLLFTNLAPCHLFAFEQQKNGLSQEIEDAFKAYYSNYENIGKHYGLKLFRNMVIRNKGAFHFYSCNSHTPQDGEYGGIAADAGRGVFECFPGTGYSILLPVIEDKAHYYTIEDGCQNEFEGYCTNMDSYSTKPCGPFLFSKDYKTQIEKDAAVMECRRYLKGELGSSKKNEIAYMDGSSYGEAQAELLFKALIGQALQMKMPDVVFYHCGGSFVRGMRNSTAAFLAKIGSEDIFGENPFCIALYEKESVSETLIYPGSLESTYRANLLAINERQKDWLQGLERQIKYSVRNLKNPKVPYDILFSPGGGKEATIFEEYVEKILQKNIQGKEYGCKLENVHMRLGSMIHVSTFYEAELLFSNRYFVDRFALMVAKGICRKFGALKQEMQKEFQITICAYGMYSELLVFRIMEILKYIYKSAAEGSIDYAILEREPKEGHLQHVDRFRYSMAFASRQERKKHFAKRKLISVVPINSTLKTQDKLLEIFCQENDAPFENFILNYSLILAGPTQKNPYWRLHNKEKECVPEDGKAIVKPNPRYFVHLPIEYQEANRCKLCYPEKEPLKEKPLVDVNAYSTIPDQSMGIRNEKLALLEEGDYFKLFDDSEKELRKLCHSLIYSHIGRNGNHFLYYFKTESLFLEWKDDIRKWLNDKKKLIEKENSWSVYTCHILFCPVHCSNTGFFEYVNQYVFHGAALVVRLDVNKEYRSNLQTKYSNLRLLIESMGKNLSCKYTICAHFVDDCIITGRSFRRMQSLAQSLLSSCAAAYGNVNTIVFERIFLLVDRNSNQSKQQYLCSLPGQGSMEEGLKNRYFSYINLNISSMRSHGDSCSICQLEWESDGLAKTSSTWLMMKYWKDRKKRFELKSVEEYEESQRLRSAKETEEEREAAKEKNYRRMYCCHMAGTLLNERCHGNQEVPAREGMLCLLLQDLAYREGDEEGQFEYFLSYLKILSRPFLVYHKPIREAIFPFLLVLAHWQLGAAGEEDADMPGIARKVWGDGKENRKTYELIVEVERKLSPLLRTRERKRDFLLVCMKQLMEMKSNYFLRRQNMMRLTSYIREWGEDKETVYDRYLRYVKKLTGVRSDTSKSMWLSEEVKKIMQEGQSERYLPQDVMCRLVLENNRAYFDGIEKLSNEQKILGPRDVESKVHTLRYQDFERYLEKNKDITYDTIWNTIRLVRYLRDEFIQMPHSEENTRKKYYDIAGLACDILKAEKVYMLMATNLECEQWRYEFWKKMKEIHGRLFPGEKYNREEEAQKKEYLVVSISREHETVLEIPISVLENVEGFEEQKRCECIDGEHGFFIWKLGMDEEHPIIFYAKFSEDCGHNLIYKCARFMVINNLLNETAFSSSAIHYLYDIVTAESNAMKLSYYKSFSHTPEDIRKQQYSDVVRDGREKYFQSHVVTLLADLRVSENYRAGLKKDYYSGNLEVCYGKLFGERSILSKIEGFYVVDGMTQEHIKINICWKELVMVNGRQLIKGDCLVPDGQEIAFKGYTNGLDDLLLLLMSLIENAASKGKAQLEGTEKAVSVYLSKTERGCLRIMNEVDEEGDLERIRFFMSNPPQPKDGISIWSVSRYLTSMECSIVKERLGIISGFLEKGGGEASQKYGSVVNLYQDTEYLLVHLPKVQVDYLKCGEKIYFSMELPVLAENVRR